MFLAQRLCDELRVLLSFILMNIRHNGFTDRFDIWSEVQIIRFQKEDFAPVFFVHIPHNFPILSELSFAVLVAAGQHGHLLGQSIQGLGVKLVIVDRIL